MTASVPVVHVSIVHPPDEPRIYERECRTLAQAGYDVTYLAPGAPAGRDAYGVRRAALPLRSRTRRWLSTREIVAELRGLRPFVVHTHDPELLTLLPLLRPFVPRLVCDVHEYVAQAIMAKEYIPAGARPAISKASGFALRELAAWADGGIVAYDGMLDQFGVRPRLRMVAPNYPRLAHFEGAAPIADLAADRRLRLVYIGALSPMRGCRLMLDVMERLDRDDALLVLGGRFSSPDLERETMARLAAGLDDRVRFLGRVPRDEVPRYMASADVVWNPMLPSVQYALPSVETKIYEGAAAGLAVLTSDLTGRTELVVGEGLGIAVAPTVDGHLGGVRRLMADRASVAAMGQRGRAITRERYSWEAFEERFLDFYDRVCSAGRRG
jgi:glycosyltransferase involved in cell wall biosynthesis